MPAPLNPEHRARITQAIREGGQRNTIAREHNVSGSTVSGIAKAEGIHFDRSQTRHARVALAEDYASRRAQLREDLLADAIKVRQRFWKPCTVFKFGGKDNTLNSIDLPEPDFEGQRHIATTVGTLVDKLAVLERVEADSTRGQQAAGLLDGIVLGLIDERARRQAEASTPT